MPNQLQLYEASNKIKTQERYNTTISRTGTMSSLYTNKLMCLFWPKYLFLTLKNPFIFIK